MQEVGILDSRKLPDTGFLHLWKAIILDQEIKDRLLAQAVLNFTLRPLIDRAELPLHGVILLVGEPGTGKTSLARGLATSISEVIKDRGEFRYIEVEPHSLTSASLPTMDLTPTIIKPAGRICCGHSGDFSFEMVHQSKSVGCWKSLPITCSTAGAKSSADT